MLPLNCTQLENADLEDEAEALGNKLLFDEELKRKWIEEQLATGVGRLIELNIFVKKLESKAQKRRGAAEASRRLVEAA